MEQMSRRRALGLSAAISVIAFGVAYIVGPASLGSAAPAEEFHGKPDVTSASPTSEPTPNGPSVLPDQASDRASEAIAERGRDAHAQGPQDDVTTEAAPTEDVTEDAEPNGPGYGPGVHAGPHGDYGPDNHPNADNHPGGEDHPDSTNHPDTSNHPGKPAGS
jgi:hypothetical protein